MYSPHSQAVHPAGDPQKNSITLRTNPIKQEVNGN
jgi:hypothetical protein